MKGKGGTELVLTMIPIPPAPSPESSSLKKPSATVGPFAPPHVVRPEDVWYM